jgi:hypothetical protein
MKELADAIGGLVKATMPAPPAQASIDLDAIARRGRLNLWKKEMRVLDDKFHPSQLADPCMRYDVVRLMVVADAWDYYKYGIDLKAGQPDPDPALFDYILHRRFDVGTALHEMEQNKYFGGAPGQLLGRWRCRSCGVIRWKITPLPDPCTNVVTVRYESGKMVEERYCAEQGQTWEYKEVSLGDKELGISARVDLPLLDTPQKIVIADLKTLGDGRWKQLERYGRPFQKDENQLKIYLYLANGGTYFPFPVEEGILRYIHQGDPEVGSVQFGVSRDPRIESWLHEYIGTVRKLAGEGRWKVASCVCTKSTQARAKRCPLSPLCFQ